MAFSERLRKLRERTGYTQTAVAKRIGISPKTMSGYENDISTPDYETLTKLASLYGVSTDYLLGHGEEGNSSSNDPSLSSIEERDIAEEIERILNGLDDEGMAYYGESPDEDDEEARELLRLSLQQSLRLAKRAAKKKFTPKKYRK